MWEHLAARDLATARFDFGELRDFRAASGFVIRVVSEAGHPSGLARQVRSRDRGWPHYNIAKVCIDNETSSGFITFTEG